MNLKNMVIVMELVNDVTCKVENVKILKEFLPFLIKSYMKRMKNVIINVSKVIPAIECEESDEIKKEANLQL